jgi:hypothetical protein
MKQENNKPEDRRNECDIDEGILQLQLYKFKTYLGSVSRAIINKQLKDIPYSGE